MKKHIPTDEEILIYCHSRDLAAPQLLPARLVRNVPCQECGADSEENCIGVDGRYRKANHMDRVFDAIAHYWQHIAGEA
jgi:hypothetical protein